MLERLAHAAPLGEIADHIGSLQGLSRHKFSVAAAKWRGFGVRKDKCAISVLRAFPANCAHA
jgi:hypothetical protein